MVKTIGLEKKGLKKSKSSNHVTATGNRLLSSEDHQSASGPKNKAQKDSRKLLNMLLIKKIRVGSNSNNRLRQQLMLNQSFDSARILPVYGNISRREE